jgi:hypothetical protein
VNTRSYTLDDGRTRVVAVVEGRAVTLHLTKYGEKASTLVTTSLSADEAYALGLFLVGNITPRKPPRNDQEENDERRPVR